MNDLIKVGSEQTVTTLELLKKINELRELDNQKPIRNNDFILKVEDELSDTKLSQHFSERIGNDKPQKYYNLNEEQCLLVGMRESKIVRKGIMNWIKTQLKNNKQLSQSEILLQQAQNLVNIEKQQQQLENRITAIETQPQINAPVQQFSIMGHCNNIGKQISMSEAQKYGLKCSKMCRDLGLMTGTVPDPRFGKVKTYPIDVLNDIIN